MKIAWYIAVSLMCLGLVFGGWRVGANAANYVAQDSGEAGPAAPYSVSLSGAALGSRVTNALAVANVSRSEKRSNRKVKSLILEQVAFERSAGGVVARGLVSDSAGPRDLRAVVDAYDVSGTYLTSAASPITTAQASSPFSVSMEDSEAFATFSVRFLDGAGAEVAMKTPADIDPATPPLMSTDALYPSDVSELADRLAALGYVDEPELVSNDVVALAVITRFRNDHDLSGPGRVTIGDLLALRAVAPSAAVRRPADLSSY